MPAKAEGIDSQHLRSQQFNELREVILVVTAVNMHATRVELVNITIVTQRNTKTILETLATDNNLYLSAEAQTMLQLICLVKVLIFP